MAKYTKLQEKHDAIEKSNKIYQERLQSERAEQKAKKKRRKRKLTYLDMPDFSKYEEFFENNLEVRDKSLFKAKSYNQEKQIEEYVSYVYFKYTAPMFMLTQLIDRVPFSDGKKLLMYENTPFSGISFFALFETIANGGSVRVLLKEFLNKKEVHYFLNSNQVEVDAAVVEAKLKYLNAKPNLIKFLLTKYRLIADPLSEKTTYILDFMAKNQDLLDFSAMEQLIDYFMATIVLDVNIQNYFKRSVNNIVIASEDWHIEQLFIKKIKKNSWDKSYQNWEFVNHKEMVFNIEEITTAKRLSQEGRKMNHCVGSYARDCADGRSSILSLSEGGESLVTIEIDKKRNMVVQVKGKYNRSITPNEHNLLSRYCQKFNIRISNYIL